jgi:predicted dehydrogenase
VECSVTRSRIRTAIIGAGFIGRIHLEAVRRLGLVDVVAIADVNGDSAQRLAEAFGVERATNDVTTVLSDGSIDTVHICAPNALHYELAAAALRAGKHVLCEKPLAVSSDQAAALVSLAAERGLRNCTCHNLRYYPMVQQMRAMVAANDLGELIIVQGTYSQDWLLYDTDWNWRVDGKDGGPLRAMADIGSHWCDLVEHITGQRVVSVCSDLATFHPTRLRPRQNVETFGGNTAPERNAFDRVRVESDDYGAVVFHLGERARGAFTVSQMSAGCKNRLSVEVYGTKAGVAWNGERPDELWVGRRDRASEIMMKDPLVLARAAAAYADLPGGHSEGYDDTFKQIFRRFYHAVADSTAAVEYPQFVDGLRQMRLLDAELASHRLRAWVDVVDAPVPTLV